MSKRKNKKIGAIVGIVLVILLLTLMIPLIINYDALFGSNSGEEPGEQQGGNVDESHGDDSDGSTDDGTENVEPVVKVYFNDVELVPGETVESTNSTTSFTVVTDKEFEVSFVNTTDYRKWLYKIGEDSFRFMPKIDVLTTSIDGNVATIVFPFDVMEWVLLQHDGVTQDDVVLPTDVNYNVPYVALEVKVEGESYLYPIQFNLNGVWSKCYLDKDEIVFCD